MKTLVIILVAVALLVGASLLFWRRSHATPANIASFHRESTALDSAAKMATLSCLLFADGHTNQLPTSFAQLNASGQKTTLSDANREFVAGGEVGSFTNSDVTIYFLEKEPRQSPDGTFARVYATVNGRVFLLTSTGEDFAAVERQHGFLVKGAAN
ncbi:MAG TPA: hypothetical protein VMH30_08565 [Verrucomicrobiae bacterium]|nr:hypothetical protein [Verrucomicrobiae bacterium]